MITSAIITVRQLKKHVIDCESFFLNTCDELSIVKITLGQDYW